ncbi:hypothetical protein SERLA73DRAFT_69336 [Serpula lacrymans var. lacrymans S7.3]|uniref:DUF6533 domain-containing protein n=1 Tax=Serpula lacrymans var. lacrymans (strain S7.3) TaxID=936435 RepID=F8PJQ9_SERL3|nr:hypothetical protein SERLA73DRAFT_69336 [Serpula lacrymans var. lacrymans S7.3]
MAELSTSPDFLFDLQTSKYFNVAGLTVWVLDYFLSFDLEVQWIWHRKWTFVRLVFTASRYLPLIGAIMTAVNALQMRTGNCFPFDLSSNIFHFLGILSAEVVSTNNIVANVAAPAGFTNLLDALQLVLHSVLASRIFFHLRESSSYLDNETAEIEISALSFSSSKFEEGDDFNLPIGETAFNVSSSFKIGDRKGRRNTYTTATTSM